MVLRWCEGGRLGDRDGDCFTAIPRESEAIGEREELQQELLLVFRHLCSIFFPLFSSTLSVLLFLLSVFLSSLFLLLLFSSSFFSSPSFYL